MSKSDEAYEREVDAARPLSPSYLVVAKSYWNKGRAYQKEQDLAAVTAAKAMRQAPPVDGFEVMAIGA